MVRGILIFENKSFLVEFLYKKSFTPIGSKLINKITLVIHQMSLPGVVVGGGWNGGGVGWILPTKKKEVMNTFEQ